MFITEQNRLKDIVEGKKILADTLEAVLEYLEDIADETTPKLTKQEIERYIEEVLVQIHSALH